MLVPRTARPLPSRLLPARRLRHANRVAGACVVVAELHVDVDRAGVLVLLEERTVVIRLGGREVADDCQTVLSSEPGVPGRGKIGEAIEAGFRDGGDLAIQRPGFFCCGRVAERPEVGDVAEDWFTGMGLGHRGGGGS